jgi:hypothetical protein
VILLVAQASEAARAAFCAFWSTFTDACSLLGITNVREGVQFLAAACAVTAVVAKYKTVPRRAPALQKKFVFPRSRNVTPINGLANAA